MFPTSQNQQPDLNQLKIQQAESVRKHLQSREAGVIIPGAQALITALALSGIAALVCFQFRWPVLVIPAVFFLSFLLSWLSKIGDWKNLVWSIERGLMVDLSGDGEIGEPAQRETIKIELTSSDKKHVVYSDLPISSDKLVDLADGLLRGQSFSEAAWSGPGALLSRAQFRQLRDECLRRGLVQWRNPEAVGQGLELTGSGRAVMRYFSSMAGSNPPTLRRDDP